MVNINELIGKYGALFGEQLELEHEYKAMGEEIFTRKLASSKEKGSFDTSTIGKKIVSLSWDDFRNNVKAILHLAIAPNKGARPKYYPILQYLVLDLFHDREDYLADKLTLATSSILVRECFKPDEASHSLTKIEQIITRLLANEIELEQCIASFAEDEKAQKKFIMSVEKGLSTRTTEFYKLHYARARMSHVNYEAPNIDRDQLQALVVKLIECMIGDGRGYFMIENKILYTKRGPKEFAIVQPTKFLTDLQDPMAERLRDNSRRLGPCVIPPQPWTNPLETSGYYGELMSFAPFIRQDLGAGNRFKKNHRKRLAMANLDVLMASVNAVQETPFKINKKVLEVWESVLRGGVGRFAGVPALTNENEPAPLGENPSEEEILTYRKFKFAWHKKATKVRSRKMKFEGVVRTARRFKDHEAIYFPHNIDYRGRIYPIPTDLHPQGDDNMKGILEFANPAPCKSEDDWKWLAITGANHSAFEGLDKKTFEERIDWVLENSNNICKSASDPLGFTWWHEVSQDEHPVCFLAFCFEWVRMSEYRVRFGTCVGFRCTIPIPFDGSCSGLQHFSAMLRDEVGGTSVNLCNTGKVEDIYGDVAEVVDEMVERDFHNGDAPQFDESGKRISAGSKMMATMWRTFLPDGIKRKVVKRSVMTLSYGSGKYGFRQNIIDDVIIPAQDGGDVSFMIGEDNLGFSAAGYLAGLITEAVKVRVAKAVEAMEFLQKIAGMITKADEVVNWITPVGLPVQQQQMKYNSSTVKVRICGSVRKIWKNEETNQIDKEKQRQSVSPNFVHSLDASHLQLVVYAARQEGMTNFNMIHDSFATDLANSGRFFNIIREQFVAMYENYDVLEAFKAHVTPLFDEKNLKKLPQVPDKGKLDIVEVLKSSYAFA